MEYRTVNVVVALLSLAIAGCGKNETNPADAAIQAEVQEAVQMATSPEATPPPTQTGPLAAGEVRELPCKFYPDGRGYPIIMTVRGEVVGGTGSDPIIGQKIIGERQCSLPKTGQ
jgi:hypothetical protein